MSYVACAIYSKYMQATNGVLNNSRDSALESRSLVVFDYKPQKRKKTTKEKRVLQTSPLNSVKLDDYSHKLLRARCRFGLRNWNRAAFLYLRLCLFRL